jgi:GntR family transcriptional regulator
MQLVIADDIRMRIESGELAPRDPIPTIQELCSRWSCSTASARSAVAILREQGLISGGRGKPLMVRVPPRRAVRSSDRHQREKDLVHASAEERAHEGTSELESGVPLADTSFRCVYEQVPAGGLAGVFKIAADTRLLQRTYETTDPKTGNVLARSVSYLPVELIAGNPALLDSAEEPWPGGTQHQLSTVGIEIARVVDEVTGVAPTTVDRQIWGLDTGIPMLRVRRISIDTEDRVVEVSDADFPADRTELVFTTTLTPW